MSEFGGLWKQQNNPACIYSVKVFRLLKLDTIRKKKKKRKKKRKKTFSVLRCSDTEKGVQKDVTGSRGILAISTEVSEVLPAFRNVKVRDFNCEAS